MFGQHRLTFLAAAVAVWLLVGSALTRARAQMPSAAPTPAVSATATAVPRAAASPSLGPSDHALVIQVRPPGLRPGDHVLIIRRADSNPAPNAAPPSGPGPRPLATPAAAYASPPHPPPPQPVPAAQAQPVAKSTPAAAKAAQPALSPIDHVLLLSVRPPGTPGPAATDHVLQPGVVDHAAPSGWTPGRELLASLNLPPGHHLTEGQELLMDTRDSSCSDPMSWTVIVHKSSYLVDVFYKGKHFDSFPAVFGRNPDRSAKMWEGDLRTPEGNYLIVEKYYNPRWRWFLRLNYPNYMDRTRYQNLREEGLVPVVHGHSRALGGAIGIHGTDRPRFNRLHINWTLGCISVENDAIEELERILPIGTLVIIKR